MPNQPLPITRASFRLATVAVLVAAMLSGCASTPSYPDPQPGEGQVLVNLKGVPRQGVKGPKRDTVRDDYSTSVESIEQGKNFERVRYDRLPDVVVLLETANGSPVHPPAPGVQATGSVLTLGKKGFDHVQCCVNHGATMALTVRNERQTAVDLFFDGEAGTFATLHLEAGKEGSIKLGRGIHDVTCDQEESAACRVFVTLEGELWCGTSEQQAFFGSLQPGDYEVSVYAPRLPVVRNHVQVSGGQRAQVTAELTVNALPKAGR